MMHEMPYVRRMYAKVKEKCQSCVRIRINLREQIQMHTFAFSHTHSLICSTSNLSTVQRLSTAEWMKWLRGKSFGLVLILHTLRSPYISFILLISSAVSELVRSISPSIIRSGPVIHGIHQIYALHLRGLFRL